MIDVVEQQEEQEVQEIDYKAFYEANKETVEKLPGLLNKQQELLAETKKAKEEKRKIAELSKQEQEALSQKNGEYEKLFRQRDEEYKKLEQQIHTEKQERRQEKINLVATKVAMDLAGDANKAELLSVFVAQNILAIADDVGNVDNDVLVSIKKQFETDAKYSALLAGNRSVGGGAPGNTRGAGADNKQIDRADFDKLGHFERAQFLQKGGKIN